MSTIGYALKIAKNYYDIETFNHVVRVATYVAENPLIPERLMDDCIALAIMHDLWEDTEYSKNDISLEEYFLSCLNLLTKSEKEDYIEYIKKIKSSADKMPEAYYVKIADMKDHLCQMDTLTDKLKRKYLKGLAYLL